MPTAKTPPTLLTLEDLASKFPHIPAECGVALVQSTILCLEGQGYRSGVELAVQGSFRATFSVSWTTDVTEAMRRYWNDPDEIAEQGAHAVALLLIRSLTGLTVQERSRKGTGFDWWLAAEDNLFTASARLEVSGVMRENARRVNERMKVKITQTERSDPSGLTAYVAVVEFSTPRSQGDTAMNAVTQEMKDFHHEAMRLADQADHLRRLGDLEGSRTHLRLALEQERRAAELAAPHLTLEPTRSVLHRSAATIAFQCGDYREAERLVAIALGGNPPETIAEELRDLLEMVYFERPRKRGRRVLHTPNDE